MYFSPWNKLIETSVDRTHSRGYTPQEKLLPSAVLAEVYPMVPWYTVDQWSNGRQRRISPVALQTEKFDSQ